MSKTESKHDAIERLWTDKEVRDFYHAEAEALDQYRLEEWLEMVSDDVRYQMPKRITRDKGSSRSEFSEKGFYFDDDIDLLESRVERLLNEDAWIENPKYRTRRLVTNVRVLETYEEGDVEYVETKSSILMVRGKSQQRDVDFVAAERHDILERTSDGLLLDDRTVYLEHTIIEAITTFL